MATKGDKLYALGGFDAFNQQEVSTCCEYNKTTDEWSSLLDLPFANA